MNGSLKDHHILLIDDDPNMHLIVRKILEKGGYTVHIAENGQQGFEVLRRESIQLILLDYMMPVMDGFEFFKALKGDVRFREFANIPVIMLTVLSENHPQRKKLLELGLSLYLNKPFGGKELINIIENVLVTNKLHLRRREHEMRRLQQARKIAIENRKLRRRVEQENFFGGIIGQNSTMMAIFERIKKVARTDASVLITGESGTGKELVARAIHEYSLRSSGSFVPVDCVALPGNLLESELFGYEKGAFTGAAKSKKGLFELADGGTFFLDEIGELSIDLQAKLLRVLQERQFRHIGGKELLDVDIRVVAATNRNPLDAVKDGILRQDLYYRLNVVPIHLPPLRDRRDDIPLLVQFFLRKFCRSNGRRTMIINEDAMQALAAYSWPGNIRELQNVIERVVSLTTSRTISLNDLPEHVRENTGESDLLNLSNLTLKEARRRWMEKFEKKYLIDLLKLSRGNISQVARRAGVNRMTVYRMLKQYNINMRLQIEEQAEN